MNRSHLLSLLAPSAFTIAFASVGLCDISTQTHNQAAERVSLRGCEILVAENQPAFVRHAIEDLQQVIQTYTGHTSPVRSIGEAGHPASVRPVIEIGLVPATELCEKQLWPGTPVSESHTVIVRWSGAEPHRKAIVSVGGIGATGLKFGILELIRHLRVSPGDVTIDVPLQVANTPRFATRSMYAHLHWSYKGPYALRSWHLKDWKRYIDLLTHLGFNTIQIWPMMELLPHPLSPEDQVYLQRYAEIIRYAHSQWGMKVFIGSCPNSITEDAKGIPIEKREYFEFEKRLDPSVPHNLRRILESRADLYKTVPDADGYWVIDSDPGGWKGSPSRAFVDILVGHRRLIDAYGTRPQEQPLIYWMWYGWGAASPPENWRITLADLKQRLKAPWRVHACHPQHLDACRDVDILHKAIYFPYGLVETEPSGPLTELRFPAIREAMQTARQAGLDAIQANAQTPLAQLPNIAYLASEAWNRNVAMDADAALCQLAEQVLCKDAEVLCEAWRSLEHKDAEEAVRLAGRLRELAKDESARGPLAVILEDWQSTVLEDLAFMLDIHVRAVVFARHVDADADRPVLVQALKTYFETAAGWLERTGYHNRRAVAHQAYRGIVVQALKKMDTRLSHAQMIEDVLDPALSGAKRTCAARLCDVIQDALLEEYR